MNKKIPTVAQVKTGLTALTGPDAKAVKSPPLVATLPAGVFVVLVATTAASLRVGRAPIFAMPLTVRRLLERLFVF